MYKMTLLHRKCCFTSKNVQIAFFGNSSRMCQYNLLGRNWSVFVVRIRRSQVKTYLKSSNIQLTKRFCLNNYPPFNHRLIITEPHSKKIFVDVHTSHRANIFSAKFLPASNIRKIVSCAGDGNILFTGNISTYLFIKFPPFLLIFKKKMPTTLLFQTPVIF